jgi:nucleotide-binding universal stress UspA family protein
MKVLVGVDDSKYADAALDFVAGMAWPRGTTVLVVSAVQAPFGAYAEPYAPIAIDTGQWVEELTKLHQQVASRAAARLAAAGLQAESRVPQGDPRALLIELAKQEQADLIVVGSHGRTGLEKLVMGSVATHVVTHAPCSVLVVRGPAGLARASGKAS